MKPKSPSLNWSFIGHRIEMKEVGIDGDMCEKITINPLSVEFIQR